MNLLNDNMRWIIILLVVLLVSGISGCDFLSGTNTGGGDPSGLTMSFESGKPPVGRTLTEDDPFQVAVNLKNSGNNPIIGELCINDVFLYTGYGGIPEPECKTVTLGGSEVGVEPSDQTIYFPDELNGYIYDNLDQYFSQQDIITASFKYNINSIGAAQLCIKSDYDVKLPSGVSCPDEETISGSNIQNMNAPIVVSSIKKSVSSFNGEAKINVEITLEKKTEGDVMNIIEYSVDLGGNKFDCGSRSGKLYFNENEKVIKCNSKINIGQDYINQLLEVSLSYSFKKIISTKDNPMELKKEV